MVSKITSSMVIFDFNKQSDISDWKIVNAEELEEVGFMIGNKVNENFELVIDKIVLE